MSIIDFTAEDYNALAWLRNLQVESGSAVNIVQVDVKSGEIKPVAELPSGLSVNKFLDVIAKLETRGLVRSFFDKKIAKCDVCGKALFKPRTACPSCNSEEITEVNVFVHSCGANVSEQLLTKTSVCPKCGDPLTPQEFVGQHLRFVCISCGEVFENPKILAECASCHSLKSVTSLKYEVIRKYEITSYGEILLEAKSPKTFLLKKLIDEGFKVSESVVVKGLSGSKHVLDVLAVTMTETRVYEVGYQIDADSLLKFAVKRLDIEKTQIPGAFGKIRWIMAGVEFDEGAKKTAETFGVEVEVVSVA